MMNADTDDIPITYLSPLQLFSEKKLVKICAPMVRYSKLAFRTLVRKYDCDLAFSPMIISNSFVRSIKARDSDFTTNSADRPLIVQFAANNADDFANAAKIVAPWAVAEGYGACLLHKPDLLCDMLNQARRRVEKNEFTVSMKIRLHKDLKDTVEMCRRAEKMGTSFISVHGRTKDQRCQPIDVAAIQAVKDAVSVPVIANGDIRSLADAEMIQKLTDVDGVMAARGILSNPAMYAGYQEMPIECIKDWLDIALPLGTSFTCFHHHLMYMLEHLISKSERNVFNSLGSMSAVLDFLRDNYDIT